MGRISRKAVTSDKTKSYHVMSRAVEGRTIFPSEEEHLRFIFQMYAANYGRPVANLYRKDVAQAVRKILRGETLSSTFVVEEHEELIYNLSFALVGNHYHFYVASAAEEGISKFMQKLKNGFAKFFNAKHERRGSLFEGPYKIVAIETESQIDAILRYVNVKNVLDVHQPGWREDGLKNKEAALRFLYEYPYSSFPDLFGERNSKLIAPEEVRARYLGEDVTQKEYFLSFIEETLLSNQQSFRNIFLED